MAKRSTPYEDEGITLKKVPDADLRLQREAQDMGRIGYWLGSRENAALYFVAGIIFFALIALLVLAFAEPSPHRTEVIKQFSTALALALGFIGGLLSAKKR
jgi:hypothetical protein